MQGGAWGGGGRGYDPGHHGSQQAIAQVQDCEAGIGESAMFRRSAGPFLKPISTPHSALRRDVFAKFKRFYVTLSVGNPQCTYGIAYRRAYGLSTSELFNQSLWTLLSTFEAAPLMALANLPTTVNSIAKRFQQHCETVRNYSTLQHMLSGSW